MKKVFVSAIIVAAGDGVRMGGVSKSLLSLGSTSVFERVLRTFCNTGCINEIICVCKQPSDFFDIIRKYEAIKPIKAVEGGKERHLSVYNGVAAVDKKSRCVCIHDCARPFVTEEIITRTVEAAISTSGCACVSTKLTDTVKAITDEGIKTPNRSKMFCVQTPQVFLRDIYLSSFAIGTKNGRAPTDETTMVEQAGFKVEYVEYDGVNLKLTTKSDYAIAKAYVKSMEG